MRVMFDFRNDKPSKSGMYLIVQFYGTKKPLHFSNCFFNAETGRWNDGDGSGNNAFEVDMWAEIRDTFVKGV